VVKAFLVITSWYQFFLPRPIREFKIHALGHVLRLMGFRRQVVLENLNRAFPGDNKQKRDRSVADAYTHLARLVFDVLALLGPMRRVIERDCELRGVEHWREAHALGKGVLFLSSHVGNWEIMAATGAMQGAMDLMIVTKHLKPEWLHQAIEAGRKRCGVLGTYEPRTLKDVLRHLKGGHTVGFILDQYAGPPVGVRVPFFGTPVGTSTALAMIAKRTGAPVIPVVNHRDSQGKWIVEVQPALAWLPCDDPKEELIVNTANFARQIEAHVRSYPDQWLWTHRRFKGDLSPLREGEWREGRSRA
jgi:KDO2-lipid IV(A) lauroyltransferase